MEMQFNPITTQLDMVGGEGGSAPKWVSARGGRTLFLHNTQVAICTPVFDISSLGKAAGETLGFSQLSVPVTGGAPEPSSDVRPVCVLYPMTKMGEAYFHDVSTPLGSASLHRGRSGELMWLVSGEVPIPEGVQMIGAASPLAYIVERVTVKPADTEAQ